MPISTEQLGRVLQGRYRIESVLGSGSSGYVFLAHDAALERKVAVKLLHPGLASDQTFLRRFKAEARAAAALNHPNIMQIHDWGEDRGEPFLVLEHLGGGSLRDLLDNGVTLAVTEVTHMGAQTARALEYAHRRGFVHRDIKPANLLFDEAGDVHVADFGLARALADATWTEPAGMFLGTAKYASPEQANGAKATARSDVYSLALVCYEALVGEPAFQADTIFAMLMARVNNPLPSSPLLGVLGPYLAAATEADPLTRPDAGTLAVGLERLALTLPAPTLPKVLSTPGSRTTHTPDETTLTRWIDETAVAGVDVGDRSPRTARRRRLVWWPRTSRSRWMVVIALVVAVSAIGAAYVRFDVYGESVPRLTGMKAAVAARVLHVEHLRMVERGSRFSSNAPLGTIIAQSIDAGAHVKKGTVVRVELSKGHAPEKIPKVVGLQTSTAVKMLSARRFVVHVVRVYNEVIPAGTIVSSAPSTASAPFGSAVMLNVSIGPHPRTIPDLSGYSAAVARLSLLRLRLVPKIVRAYSSSVPAGQVISSTPSFGTTGVVVGTTVTLTISRGPELVAVPPVAGDSISLAITTLQNAGLVVAEQIGPPFASTAVTTDPVSGTDVAIGSSVTLYAE